MRKVNEEQKLDQYDKLTTHASIHTHSKKKKEKKKRETVLLFE